MARHVHEYIYTTFADFIQGASGEACSFWPEGKPGHRGDVSFYGTETREEALELLANGWPEGREKVQAAIADADTVTHTTEPRLEPVVAGFIANVPAYLSGQPRAMYRMVHTETAARPIVRLLVERWTQSGTPTKCIRNYGIALMELIGAIESKGQRVELTLSAMCKGDDGSYVSVQAPIKRADERMEMDRLAFVLGHEAFLRQILFGLYGSKEELRHVTGGWAGSLIDQSAYDAVIARTFDADQYMLPLAGHHITKLSTLAGAREFLNGYWQDLQASIA